MRVILELRIHCNRSMRFQLDLLDHKARAKTLSLAIMRTTMRVHVFGHREYVL